MNESLRHRLGKLEQRAAEIGRCRTCASLAVDAAIHAVFGVGDPPGPCPECGQTFEDRADPRVDAAIMAIFGIASEVANA